jgi:hypothetical protein
MKTFEITLADDLHDKLEMASKRVAKPIDQFVHELLARVLENIESHPTTSTKSFRPYGLCAGEFVVPDDFDDPLPENIIAEFEGR